MSFISGEARAAVASISIDARCSILARVFLTFVNVYKLKWKLMLCATHRPCSSSISCPTLLSIYSLIRICVIILECNARFRTCKKYIVLAFIPFSQYFPLKPEGQVQLWPPWLLVHFPPFLHGLFLHSSTSRNYRDNKCCDKYRPCSFQYLATLSLASILP